MAIWKLDKALQPFRSLLRNESVISLAICNFLAALAIGLTTTLIPLLISDFSPSFTLLGVTTSLSALSSMFFMPVTSYLSDTRFSRKITLVMLLGVYSLATSLLLFVGDVFVASIYFLLVGLAGGHWTISKVLVIENTNTEEVTTGIGTTLGLRNLARLFIGPFLAGFLVLSSFVVPFYVSMSFALASLVVALAIIKEPRRTILKRTSNPAKVSTCIRTLLSNRVFLACSLVYVEMGIWHNWYMIYAVLYADKILHYSVSLICFIFSLGGLAAALAQIFAGIVERFVDRKKLVVFCSFVGGLAPTFVSFSFTPFFFAAILISWAFFTALKDPLLAPLVGSCSNSLRATVFSFVFVVMNISIFFGGIIAGIIWDSFGGNMLNLMVTISSLVILIPLAFLLLAKTCTRSRYNFWKLFTSFKHEKNVRTAQIDFAGINPFESNFQN